MHTNINTLSNTMPNNNIIEFLHIKVIVKTNKKNHISLLLFKVTNKKNPLSLLWKVIKNSIILIMVFYLYNN